MHCHKQIWRDSPVLAPVRNSFASGDPLRWTRVHDLPQFVYFNHRIHVAKGIACESCHGRVDKMPLMQKASSLEMKWCLDCHRHPEQNIQPRKDVFAFGFSPRPVGSTAGEQLVDRHHVNVSQLTDCGICHR